VSREHSGAVEIPWMEQSAEYYFRVYWASQPDVSLDTVKVRRESSGNILSELTTEVIRGNIDPFELSRFIAKVMARCLHSVTFCEIFRYVTPQIISVCPIETSIEPLACGATFNSKLIEQISSDPRPSFRGMVGNLDVAGICATKDFAVSDEKHQMK